MSTQERKRHYMNEKKTDEKSMLDTIKRIFKTFAIEAIKFEQRRDPSREYPSSVQECIDDDMTFKPEVYAALKKFRQSHPWRGTQGEIQFKFRVLNENLAAIYNVQIPQLVFVDKFPVGACCFPTSKP